MAPEHQVRRGPWVLPATVAFRRDGGKERPAEIARHVRRFLHGGPALRWWRLFCRLMDVRVWTPVAEEPHKKHIFYFRGCRLVTPSPCRSFAIPFALSPSSFRVSRRLSRTALGTRHRRRSVAVVVSSLAKVFSNIRWYVRGSSILDADKLPVRLNCMRNFQGLNGPHIRRYVRASSCFVAWPNRTSGTTTGRCGRTIVASSA